MVQAQNRLSKESSPYLKQHETNPVDWYPWGEEAFEQARKEKKPVLLSVGYAACHWCHVMAHESFEDKKTATLMNELFINIKVDREERPDVDSLYQAALSGLGQQGGWPLTMFLTPDGDPFWGGTYFPPEDRMGRPGFKSILKTLAETYDQDKTRVQTNIDGLNAILNKKYQNRKGQLIHPNVLTEAATRLNEHMDGFYGGIGEAPKFPNVPLLQFLWRCWKRTGDQSYFRAVDLSLLRMCQGGIYDHIGGGFARYTVDRHWLIPHFEKMLYDNALMIELLTEVWQDTKNPVYEARIRETIDWLQREMMALKYQPSEEVQMSCDADFLMRSNLFAASQDADSEGEEGKYYIWDEAEIDKILGRQSHLFKEVYNISTRGNWEGKNILNRSHNPKPRSGEDEQSLAEMREVLLAHRMNRVKPGWDDKVLADWNCMMIHSLAQASQVFAEDGWLIMAKEAFSDLNDLILKNGDLFHSWRRDRFSAPALLDDFAWLARSALTLYEVTGEQSYLLIAEKLADRVEELFVDEVSGGYFQTPRFDAESTQKTSLPHRVKTADDAAVPSGNAVMLGLLTRLYYLTGNKDFAVRSDRLEEAFAGNLFENFYPLCGFMSQIEYRRDPIQILIIGYKADPKTQEMIRQVCSYSIPNKTLQVIEPDMLEKELPGTHPAYGRSQKDGKTTAYLCRNQTCSAPLTQALALGNSLKLMTGLQRQNQQ
ncbi:thioredoxin domain-containing protein [Kiloniella sp. b19]|uniref:thioredoxin domain-containing protein n=1 Tax=Kiloniella sp. GXU_MW_B19 TaxID=3141326 RepID=UPI0031D8EF4A